MISARLVGDDAVIEWLLATPDTVASGLARVITMLGLELQNRVQETPLAGQLRVARAGWLQTNVELQTEGDGERIAARVTSAGNAYSAAPIDVKASLHRIKRTLGAPISKRPISQRSHPRRPELSEQSFLRTALEDMDPEIRDAVEAALHEALKRG